MRFIKLRSETAKLDLIFFIDKAGESRGQRRGHMRPVICRKTLTWLVCTYSTVESSLDFIGKTARLLKPKNKSKGEK